MLIESNSRERAPRRGNLLGNARLRKNGTPFLAIDLDLFRPAPFLRIGELDFEQPWARSGDNLVQAQRGVHPFPYQCGQSLPAFNRGI